LIFSWCYHLFNGIRHLMWDFSDQGELLLTKEKVKSTAWFIAACTIFSFIFLLFLLS
jgi:succinate dehydrogenase/fumarate reductase cytochrome b subunit